ncbi:PRP18 Pre-mRNA-splicing factor 18 [Candida maltosa Xu316]
MDFSNLISKEIDKKRKNLGSKKTKKKQKKQKAPPNPETAPEEISPPTTTTKNNELSEEQINFKLSELGEQDDTLSKQDKVKKLQLLLQLQVKNTKYKKWLDKEAELYGDPEKQRITLDLITNINQKKDEVCLILRVYIKELIKQWEESDHDELLLETKRNIVKLLYKLRSGKLNLEMLISLSTIIYHIQQNEFNKANESYMKLSIGNVCWPIGVVNIGIHARSAASKITGANSVSNIMLNESTRRWIISIKRLITFKERLCNQ